MAVGGYSRRAVVWVFDGTSGSTGKWREVNLRCQYSIYVMMDATQECELGTVDSSSGVIHDIAWAPAMGRSYHLIATASRTESFKVRFRSIINVDLTGAVPSRFIRYYGTMMALFSIFRPILRVAQKLRRRFGELPGMLPARCWLHQQKMEHFLFGGETLREFGRTCRLFQVEVELAALKQPDNFMPAVN
jgi:hypothetical protein